MNHRQRVLAAIRGEPTDTIAVAPYIYDAAAQFAGVPLQQFYTDGQAMANAQLALHGVLGQDVIAVGCDNYYIAEGFGCEIEYQPDELPTLRRGALESLQSIDDLTVPDPQCDGRMPVMLSAIRRVRQAVGGEIAIRSPGTGPFALASYLIGTQQWLYEVGLVKAGMADGNEPAIHRALELATAALIAFGKACADAGADILHCGDSLASCNVISPATYRRFAKPYQQRVFQAWREHGATATLLHICGDSSQVIGDYAETGPDVIEVDHAVDLRHARQVVGRRVALMGNVHTVTELLQGKVSTVRRACQACIAQDGPSGRFVLGSGCIVPRLTPLANLLEMVRVAREAKCGGGVALGEEES